MKDYFFLEGGVYGSAMDEIVRKCAYMCAPGMYTEKQKQRLEKIAKKHRCLSAGKRWEITMKMKMIDQIVYCVIFSAIGVVIGCACIAATIV